MKKIFLLFLILFLTAAVASPALAQHQLSINSSVPSTVGVYSSLQLVPRNPLPDNPCKVGTFFVKITENIMYYCQNGTVFQPLTSPWTESGNDVYLTGDQAARKVGIGTVDPEFKLTMDNDGGIIAKGTSGVGEILATNGPGTRLIWYPRKHAFRAGIVTASSPLGGTEWNDANIGLSSVAFGQNNIAKGSGSAVSGGSNNVADGTVWLLGVIPIYGYSTVAGGWGNTAGGPLAFVGGGSNNQIPVNTGLMAFIGGGGGFIVTDGNTATGDHAVVVGGSRNDSTGWMSTVGGGFDNDASGNNATATGGTGNKATGSASTVSGGLDNQATEHGNTVGGGQENRAMTSQQATVAGGLHNYATGTAAAIGGGLTNTASAQASTIAGGDHNEANGINSTVAGGLTNLADGVGAMIGGGSNNIASGNSSFVGGGDNNEAIGDFSFIPGGAENIAAGEYSMAAGRNMVLDSAADRTFVWGHSNSAIPAITNPDSFIIYSGDVLINPTGAAGQGNVGVGTSSPQANVDIRSSGETTLYIHSSDAGTAGRIILQDDGGSCWELKIVGGELKPTALSDCP